MPYGVRVLQCLKKLTANLEIKLVNVKLCSCSWYILNILSGLAYAISEGFSIAREMFQVNMLET